MKIALTIVSALLALLLAAIGYGAYKFSAHATQRGDEWLLLLPTQANECLTGGGCVVFSQREFDQAALSILQRYCRRGAGV